tara:strand:+ start:175 stop:387 length:213 start_codon:yes stop_codon:yes gene_type:complete
MMNKNNTVWKTFLEYQNLISSEGKAIGLDIFGTDQIWTMALQLTQAHFTNELGTKIDSLFAADGEIKGEC